MIYKLTFFAHLINFVTGASRFDNAVVGVPVISCERDQIRVEVETEKPFGGKIFVKGEFRNSQCGRLYLNGRPVSLDEFESKHDADARKSQRRTEPPRGSPPIENWSQTSAESNGSEGDDSETLGGGTTSSNQPAKASQQGSSGEAGWSGTGGAKSSSTMSHQPFVTAFGGTRDGVLSRENETFGDNSHIPLPPDLKVFPKKPESGSMDTKLRDTEVSSPITLMHTAPDGSLTFTKAECDRMCSPCACPSVVPETRRRRETNRVELVVPLGACNAKRDRTMNPPTMTTSFVAVVSFHDSFITKLDRAYHIQCQYTEKSMPVSTELNVSMSPPSDLAGSVDPPVCQYKIGGTDGTSIQNVRVGDLVRHEWICESPVQELFSMLVHDCFVEDGSGERYRVVDEYGCSSDKYVLSTPQYSSSVLSASVDAFMFKFPDKSSVDFQCSIKICSKEDNDCNIITPPSCNLSRRRRSPAPAPNDSMTLHSNTLTVLDVDSNEQSLALSGLDQDQSSEPLCISIAGFGILVSTATFLSTVSIAVIIGHYYIKSLDKHIPQ